MIAPDTDETSFTRPPLDPVDRATEAMIASAAELLLRAQEWSLLHARCAVARELPAGATAFTEAAETFAELIDEASAYGLSEGRVDAARDAYWSALRVTERESRHKLSSEFLWRCRAEKLRELGVTEEQVADDLTGDLARTLSRLCGEAAFAELCKQKGFAQLHEVEGSAIRELLNSFDCITQHYGEMIDGVVAPLEAQARAAEELLDAPSSPSVQDIIQCE